MLAPFPHRYSASLSRTFAPRGRIDALRPALASPSPELTSDVGAGTAEHMLLSSLGLCLLTEFEARAAREGIELLAWRAQVNGTAEHTPEGPMFTSIVVELDVDIDGNTERFDDVLDDAKRTCLVQNALRVPVVVETQVRTPCIPAPIDDALEMPHYPTSGVPVLHAS
jgi:organic hydroperoxide reductase OsmC/OhrA